MARITVPPERKKEMARTTLSISCSEKRKKEMVAKECRLQCAAFIWTCIEQDNTQDFEKERLKLNREAARIAMQDIEDIAKKHIYDDYQFYTDSEKLGIYSKKDNPLLQIGRYITKK